MSFVSLCSDVARLLHFVLKAKMTNYSILQFLACGYNPVFEDSHVTGFGVCSGEFHMSVLPMIAAYTRFLDDIFLFNVAFMRSVVLV